MGAAAPMMLEATCVEALLVLVVDLELVLLLGVVLMELVFLVVMVVVCRVVVLVELDLWIDDDFGRELAFTAEIAMNAVSRVDRMCTMFVRSLDNAQCKESFEAMHNTKL